MARSGCSSIIFESILSARLDKRVGGRRRSSQPSFLRSLTRLADLVTHTLTPPPAGWLGSDRLHYHGETIHAQPGVETRFAFGCWCGGLQGGFSAPGGDGAEFGFVREELLLLVIIRWRPRLFLISLRLGHLLSCSSCLLSTQAPRIISWCFIHSPVRPLETQHSTSPSVVLSLPSTLHSHNVGRGS